MSKHPDLFSSAWLSSGALAELGSTLGSNLSEYVAKVLPVLFRELRCDDPGNRRNAAYCAGVFCQHAPQQMQNQIAQLLQVGRQSHTVFRLCIACCARVVAKVLQKRRLSARQCDSFMQAGRSCIVYTTWFDCIAPYHRTHDIRIWCLLW